MTVELGPEEPRLPSRETGAAGETLPAFQLKKILVPVDFSTCSLKALRYAIPFATQFGAELILLHVIPLFPPAEGVLPADPGEDVHERLAALRATAGAAAGGITLVRRGTPHSEILDVAQELDVGLIILSTHGHTGLEHLLLGSVAEKVVRHAGCPVLIVREHEHEFVEDRAAP